MSKPTAAKIAEWREKAEQKNAIVPEYFVVYPEKVDITCGNCHTKYSRRLLMNVNGPTYVCPNETCKKRNFVPVWFKKKK